MGVYILFLYLGATLAPLLGGFIFNGLGWQAVLVSRPYMTMSCRRLTLLAAST